MIQQSDDLQSAWLHFLPKAAKPVKGPADLRPIALQPVAGKVFSLVLKHKLQPYVDLILDKFPQYAYAKGRGTLEAIARVAQHCDHIRSIVHEQKMGLHEKKAGARKRPCAGGRNSPLISVKPLIRSLAPSCGERLNGRRYHLSWPSP